MIVSFTSLIIRRREITLERIPTSYWVNLAATSTLTGPGPEEMYPPPHTPPNYPPFY